MKKNVLILGLLALTLAACSGGSNGGGIPSTPAPIVTPTPTQAPVSFTARLVFHGSMTGNAQIQGEAWRSAQSGTSTPPPVMVLTPTYAGMDTSGYGGQMQVEVDPAPSSTPSVVFTQDNDAAVLTTPPPVPSGATPAPLPSGVLAQASIYGSNATVQTQSAGTASAAIASPVSLTPTINVYSYRSVDLECRSEPWSPQQHYGWSWNGTSWTADDSPSTDDIWIDGPGCLLPDVSGETGPTIHVPGGMTLVSTDYGFADLTATQWSNDQVVWSLESSTVNPDGSETTVLIGKTTAAHGSHVFATYPNFFAPLDGYFGGIKVSGDAPDGF